MDQEILNGDEKPARVTLLKELGGVIKLSLPIIITMTSQALMQFVDALMIGQVGRDSMAAVAPAGLTFFTLASLVMGIVGCNNTFVSQSLGRGKLHECGRYTVHALYIAFASQLLVLPIILFAPRVFQWYGHAPAVVALEAAYFRALAFRLAAAGMIVSASTFFQGTGRPVIPMITGITANLLNIGLNYLLIFGKFGFPAMGLFGAGIATTLSSYSEAFMLLALFLGKQMHAVYQTRRWLPVEFRRIRQLLRIGIASGITFAMDLASWTIFMAVVIGRLGTDILAGNNAASEIMHLSFMPAIGLNIGITALVGRHIGEGQIPLAKRAAYLGMACACAYMTFNAIIFFIFRRPLIGLFQDDPAVIAAGAVSLTYIALFQFSDSIGIISAGALKGAGDTRFTAIAQIVCAWIFFLPLVIILGNPNVWGLHGAWIAATIYIWIFDIILFLRFRSEAWRKIDIFK